MFKEFTKTLARVVLNTIVETVRCHFEKKALQPQLHINIMIVNKVSGNDVQNCTGVKEAATQNAISVIEKVDRLGCRQGLLPNGDQT